MKLYIDLFGISVPSYGLMIVIGVVLANIVAFLMIYTSQRNKKQSKNSEEKRLDYNDLFIMEAYCILGGFLGAKLLYVLVSFEEIEWNNILTISGFNTFMQAGFVFYGGLIGGALAAVLAGKIHYIDTKLYFNEFILLIPMIHGFGRIGCFMAGCCYGIPYDGIGATVFPENSFAISGIKLFPVQLAEAIGLFCIFGIMLILKVKYNIKHMVELYCLLYAVLRFILEFFRYDVMRGRLWLLSTSQWISLTMVVGIICWLGVSLKKRLGEGYESGK